MTVSGRPAFFNSGGEFPILVPQSLGTVSIEYKKFGTQIDFVPIVLGNGNHSLGSAAAHQRNRSPRAASPSTAPPCPACGFAKPIPAWKCTQAKRWRSPAWCKRGSRAEKREIPWLGEMPYVGAAFRRTSADRGRSRIADFGDSGSRRGARLRRSAAVLARHAHRCAQRLRAVLEGLHRSALQGPLRTGRMRLRWPADQACMVRNGMHGFAECSARSECNNLRRAQWRRYRRRQATAIARAAMPSATATSTRPQSIARPMRIPVTTRPAQQEPRSASRHQSRARFAWHHRARWL